MQQHYSNQKPDERLAVALWWKRSWDEDRVGPAEARRHWRWGQAGLVSVDHGGERPGVRDIPCTSELQLCQATAFFSCDFLEALNSSTCRSVKAVTFMCTCVYVCVLSKIPCCISSFLCVRSVFLYATWCHEVLYYSVFLCQCGNTSIYGQWRTNSH